MNIGSIVTICVIALACILVGYLIAVKQKRVLIAGWDESKVSNPVAYAQLVGYSVLSLGLLLVAISIIGYLGIVPPIGIAILLFISSLIPVVCAFMANRTYGNSDS